MSTPRAVSEWCSGWIPDRSERSGRRRCGIRLDPALVAAGITVHPCCEPGPEPQRPAARPPARQAPVPEPPEPDAETARALAARLAEVDRLDALHPPVTGAAVHAGLWPDGPPWEHGRSLRPRPNRWPPGTNGAWANRGARWQTWAG